MVRPELVRLLSQYGKTEEIKEVVPPDQINEWDELVERRDNTSDPVYHQQICERITEILQKILPNITNLNWLFTMWREALAGSDDEKLIEARMKEVVNTTTDWYELNNLWDNIPYDCTIECMTSERIAQLISRVSADECPDWFLVLLRDPDSCVVRDVLEQKIKDLKAELDIAD